MKKLFLLIFSIGIFLSINAFASKVSRVTPNDSLSTVLQQLEAQGYSQITEVEYENGAYKVKAVDKEGKRVKFRYTPTAQSITPVSQSTTQNRLTLLQVVQKLEAAGYKNIYDMEFEKGLYKAKAINPQGKKVELHIDPATGKISKEWF